MSAALRYLYVDSVKGFTEVGDYTVAGALRIVYTAPLPRLALLITPGYTLEHFKDQTVGIYLGWAEKREPGTQNAWGHYPNLSQSKISVVCAFEKAQARMTLSALLRDCPMMPEKDIDYALD